MYRYIVIRKRERLKNVQYKGNSMEAGFLCSVNLVRRTLYPANCFDNTLGRVFVLDMASGNEIDCQLISDVAVLLLTAQRRAAWS